MKKYAQETICIQGGYEPKNGEPRILPIFQSTTYKYDEADEVAKLFDLEAAGHMYSRISNLRWRLSKRRLPKWKAALALWQLLQGRRQIL